VYFSVVADRFGWEFRLTSCSSYARRISCSLAGVE